MALHKVTDTETRAKPAPYNAPRALVSSAARLQLNNKSEAEKIRHRSAIATIWQNLAWACYGGVGEVNYAFNYSAAVLSRVRIHAAVVLSPDAAPVEVTDATQVSVSATDGSTKGVPHGIDPRLAMVAIKHMNNLSARGGIAPMLKSFGLNMQVAGECYFCCIDERWSIRSTSELKIDAAGRPLLQESAATASIQPRYLKKTTPVARIWNQHPRFSKDADSSLRAVLDDCEELILLARLMRVAARSRLNAGILFVSSELSASARTVGGDVNDINDESEITEDEDPLEKELFASMTAPISQEDNAAAIVPLLIRGPAEEGNNIKYIQMGRDVGTELSNRSKDVLNRVLQGINAPKELVSGMSGSRYNNAKLIDEQSYKALVEPMALTFSDAMTEVYLRPLLLAEIQSDTVADWDISFEDLKEQVMRIVCWYDPSEVVTSIDMSAAANDGWDRKALSDSAWRKAHGFNDNDRPSELELARRLVMSQVALDPTTQQNLLHLTLPSVFAAIQKASQDQNGIGLPPDLQDTLSGTGAVAPSPPVDATSVPQGVSAS